MFPNFIKCVPFGGHQQSLLINRFLSSIDSKSQLWHRTAISVTLGKPNSSLWICTFVKQMLYSVLRFVLFSWGNTARRLAWIRQVWPTKQRVLHKFFLLFFSGSASSHAIRFFFRLETKLQLFGSTWLSCKQQYKS